MSCSPGCTTEHRSLYGRPLLYTLHIQLEPLHEAKYANGILCQLPYPTDDSRLIIKAVQAGLQQLYREGFSYAKAQVMLLDLCRKNEYTPDLFALNSP